MRGIAVNAGARIPHVGSIPPPADKPEFIFVGAVAALQSINIAAHHQAGDLLVVHSKGLSFVPGLLVGGPSPGWQSPVNGTWQSTLGFQGHRLQWIVDSDNSISLIPSGNSTITECFIYRGSSGIGNCVNAVASATSSIAAPSLDSSITASLMLELFSIQLGVINSVSGSGLTARYNQDISLGGGDVVMLESDTVVGVSPAATALCSESTYPVAVTFELLP